MMTCNVVLTIVAKDLISEDQTLVNQDNIEHIAEDFIITDQIPVNQDIMENNESKLRTSTRNKRVPITMSKDFLW
jgi:hypothetical protein